MSRRWLLGSWIAAMAVISSEAAENRIGEVRTALEKWVETRQLIGKTRADWRVDKETLEQTVRLFEQERASIREQMSSVSTNSATAALEQTESAAVKAALVEGIDSVQTVIAGLETKLRDLTPAFPSPLIERIQPVLRRLPGDSTASKLSAVERYQTIVTLLNEIDKFNGAVTVASEIQKNPTGAEVQVETMYLGLAQAYFVDKSGGYAGIGLPSLQGWKWESQPELALKITQALSIYKNASPAAFVGLPVQIH